MLDSRLRGCRFSGPEVNSGPLDLQVDMLTTIPLRVPTDLGNVVPFTKVYCMNSIRASNSLDPGQALHIVGTDLGPNFLQRFSADDKSGH